MTTDSGAGKTSAARGFIKAVQDLSLPYRIVICAEKIEALCELWRDLTNDDGIPVSKVSLLHSYIHDPGFDRERPKEGTASEKPTDPNDLQQFVLMSHSKLHHGFNKLDHDLLIYDESLLLGEASSVPWEIVMQQGHGFIGRVTGKEDKASDDQKAMSLWLSRALNTIGTKKDGATLTLPDLPIDIAQARKADRPIHGNDQTLRNLFSAAYDKLEVRILKDLSQGSSLIHYRQTIPNDLNKVAILDASYKIRKLMAYDDTVTTTVLRQDIKHHGKVTIHHCNANAGRGSIIGGLQKGELKLFDEASYLIAKLLNDGRKVLVFTFKEDGKAKPIATLRDMIEENLGHSIDRFSNGAELNFLTWGYETALNAYSHCDAVVFAGLLTLPHSEVAGRVLAQARDIKIDLSSQELNEVVQSEKVHSLYQALSRGSCRVMNDGKANAMDAYIFSHDHHALTKALAVAMPGVVFKDYKPKYLKSRSNEKDDCKKMIIATLDKCDTDKVSKTVVFKACSVFKSGTRKNAMNELLEDPILLGWSEEERSLVRIN